MQHEDVEHYAVRVLQDLFLQFGVPRELQKAHLEESRPRLEAAPLPCLAHPAGDSGNARVNDYA